MKKLASILLTLAVAVSLLVVPAVVSAGSAPIIDGIIGTDEWGEPFGTYEQTIGGVGTFYFDLYITSDDEYLYVATDYVEGSGDVAFSAAKGLGLAAGLNIYIDANNDDSTAPSDSDLVVIVSNDMIYIPYDPPVDFDWEWQEEGSASAAEILIAWDGDGYTEGKGIVEVAVPLSLLDASLGDTIGLLFQAFGNINFAPLWQTNPDDTHCGWPETYTDFTLEANTAVGLAAETPAITAINVDPTSINFGSITPGTPVSKEDITVENIGGVAVVVDAFLDPQTGTVFTYLRLGGSYSGLYTGGSKYNGYWNNIISSLLPSKNAVLTTELDVPETYSGKGAEEATLIFEATAG